MRQVKYQEGKFALGNILCAVIPNDDNFVLAKYLQIYLHLYRNELLVSQMKGMANVSLPMNRIADVQVEIPDIEKQRKIVEIEKKVTQNSVKLHQLFFEQKGLASKLKQTVLQNAIQGKLTAEWRKEHPAEEPASELLKRIKLEKQQMIASGKLKKEKPLEPIKPEEIPFEIPESWTWCRLGEIFDHSSGKQLNSSDKEGSLRKYITTSNLYWGRFELNSLKEMYFSEKELDRCCAKKGDLLVCEGGDIGRAAIWNGDTDIYLQNHIHRMRPFREFFSFYSFYILYSYKMSGLIDGKGMGIKGLSANALRKIVIPLPPLSEQQEIVRRIDAIMNTVNSLENQISESERTSEELLKAIVGEVMG